MVLFRGMTSKANTTIMKERIWIDRAASETVCQPLDQDTGAPLHDARAIDRSRSCILLSTYCFARTSVGVLRCAKATFAGSETTRA